MRAVFYERFGAAPEVLRLGELPDPKPSPGCVVVRVHASGINPADVKQRSGALGAALPFPRIVPHNDGAGIVVAAGAGVSPDRIGAHVWLYGAQQGQAFGTAAGLTALPAERAVPLPAAISFAQGAGLGVPALTAWHAVHGYCDVAGKCVLVTGGAGAVGEIAVRLAAARGARVIAGSRSVEGRARAIAAGARHALDVTGPDAAAEIMDQTGSRGVDLAIDVDTSANGALIAKVAAQNGIVASYGSGKSDALLPVRELRLRNLGLHFFNVFRLNPSRIAGYAQALTRFIEARGLALPEPIVLPLDECAAAHQRVERGAGGKVVLDCGEER